MRRLIMLAVMALLVWVPNTGFAQEEEEPQAVVVDFKSINKGKKLMGKVNAVVIVRALKKNGIRMVGDLSKANPRKVARIVAGTKGHHKIQIPERKRESTKKIQIPERKRQVQGKRVRSKRKSIKKIQIPERKRGAQTVVLRKMHKHAPAMVARRLTGNTKRRLKKRGFWAPKAKLTPKHVMQVVRIENGTYGRGR